MEIGDLTGRHTVTILGTPPTLIDSSEVAGGKYLNFDGTGCLALTGALDDFKWGAGPACIEVVVWQTSTLAIYSPGEWPYGNTIFDGGRRYDGVSSTQVPALSGSNAYDPTICTGPHSYARFPFPTPIPGWRKLRYDLDTSGVCTLFVDGVVVGSETAFNVNSIPAGKLLVGGSIYGATDWAYTTCKVAGLRITRASRAGRPFDLLAVGADDPLWSQTVLNLSLTMAGTPGDGGGDGGGEGEALLRGDHDDLLRRLLPPLSFDRNGTQIMAETLAYGAALDKAQAAAQLLLAEADPRTTGLLLGDWERNYGLEAGTASDSVRRSALVAQILSGGGQSRAFYVSLAAAMGYTATVTESTPHTVMSEVTFPLYSGAWRHVWKVRAHANAGAVSNAAFEALINKLKPAHTRVIFEYY